MSSPGAAINLGYLLVMTLDLLPSHDLVLPPVNIIKLSKLWVMACKVESVYFDQ